MGDLLWTARSEGTASTVPRGRREFSTRITVFVGGQRLTVMRTLPSETTCPLDPWHRNCCAFADCLVSYLLRAIQGRDKSEKILAEGEFRLE
jgi:hypothetical protein